MIGHAETSMLPLLARAPSINSWISLIDDLHRIRTLEDDWDGEGSKSPDATLVDAAIAHARKLEAEAYPPADRVCASVNGTIYFEWRSPLGYQEIEILSPTDAECRCGR